MILFYYYLQTTLENEKQSFQKQMIEETESLRHKQKEFSQEKMKFYHEQQTHITEFEYKKSKIESEKLEFNNHIQTKQTALQMEIERFQSEKFELEKLKNTVTNESKLFETQKYEIMKKQSELDAYQASLNLLNEKTTKEKLLLDKAAYELKLASENLQHEINIVNIREKETTEKDNAILKKIKDYESQFAQLNVKEQELNSICKTIEAKLIHIENEENKLYEKKVAMVSAQRELLNIRQGHGQGQHAILLGGQPQSAQPMSLMRQSWSGPSSNNNKMSMSVRYNNNNNDDDVMNSLLNHSSRDLNNRSLIRNFQSNNNATATLGLDNYNHNYNTIAPPPPPSQLSSSFNNMPVGNSNQQYEDILMNRVHHLQSFPHTQSRTWIEQFESDLNQTKGSQLMQKHDIPPSPYNNDNNRPMNTSVGHMEMNAIRNVLSEAEYRLQVANNPHHLI